MNEKKTAATIVNIGMNLNVEACDVILTSPWLQLSVAQQ